MDRNFIQRLILIEEIRRPQTPEEMFDDPEETDISHILGFNSKVAEVAYYATTIAPDEGENW